MAIAEEKDLDNSATNGRVGETVAAVESVLKVDETPAKSPKKANRRKHRRKKSGNKSTPGKSRAVAFPKDSLLKCLRIPRAILEQNAGKECRDRDAASFAKLNYAGEIGVEISSALKFGLLERPAPGTVKPTDLVRRIVRPQTAGDHLEGLREAVLKAPLISDVYKHYRGENLPETNFLTNTAIDTFKVPADKVQEFVGVLLQTLKEAELLEDVDGKTRVLDVTHTVQTGQSVGEEQIKAIAHTVSVRETDTCFVVMPFVPPQGGYYTSIYEPAIKKAKLTPLRADTDIFGTGKIIDQIWSGINNASVLVAELTGRNPNVLYELGLAHALRKPVVLVSSNEQDVPFDVRHVRVIYYDVMDPFWGPKLVDKVAENILSALKNPKEAILFPK
jgi:hypothetical protein